MVIREVLEKPFFEFWAVVDLKPFVWVLKPFINLKPFVWVFSGKNLVEKLLGGMLCDFVGRNLKIGFMFWKRKLVVLIVKWGLECWFGYFRMLE